MVVRDLALTVLELEPHEFHWVLMEAVQADADDCLVYRPVESSTRGLPDYSEALIQGASALRVFQGLAPFGAPATGTDKPARPAGAPAAAVLADTASDQLLTTDQDADDEGDEADHPAPQTCMFTTDNPVI